VEGTSPHEKIRNLEKSLDLVENLVLNSGGKAQVSGSTRVTELGKWERSTGSSRRLVSQRKVTRGEDTE